MQLSHNPTKEYSVPSSGGILSFKIGENIARIQKSVALSVSLTRNKTLRSSRLQRTVTFFDCNKSISFWEIGILISSESSPSRSSERDPISGIVSLVLFISFLRTSPPTSWTMNVEKKHYW